MKAQQAAFQAYRSLRSIQPHSIVRSSADPSTEALNGSVRGNAFWNELRVRMHDAKLSKSPAASRSADFDTPSWKERWYVAFDGISPRWKLATAAAILGASLLALGIKVASFSSGSVADRFAPSVAAEHDLWRAGNDARRLESAGVLHPMTSERSPIDLDGNAGEAVRRVQFVGRTGPNSNY